MINKKLIAVATAVTILGGATTAFAAGGSYKASIKPVRESIKTNVEALKAKKGNVMKAVDAKKAEAGFAQVDKTQFASKLQEIKTVKEEIAKLQSDFKAAKDSKDKGKMVSLRVQISSKVEQVYNAVQALAPYKNQLKKNKEVSKKMEPLKEQLKTMGQERAAIFEKNKTLGSEIKALREKLKTAVKEDKSDDISNITAQIVEKLNSLNDNLTKVNNLKDEAVSTVNAWK